MESKPNIDQVVDAYLAYSANCWSDMYLRELVGREPEVAWKILTRVIESASLDILYFVAAGPLEDLVVAHGEDFLEVISTYARSSPKMQQALGGVWGENQMPKKVWKQIQKLAASYDPGA